MDLFNADFFVLVEIKAEHITCIKSEVIQVIAYLFLSAFIRVEF